MERFDSLPRNAVEGWPQQLVKHPPLERVPFHYHAVEEWLQVMHGALTFVAPGGAEIPVTTGQALRLPPGEVHRVDIGPDGTSYEMWTARDERDDMFAHPVSEDLLALIARNLTLPEVENRWDRRNRDQPTPRDREDETFLLETLSPALVFRTGKGGYLDRGHYLRRPPPNPLFVRSSSGSVQVLHEGADSLLLSTVVHTSRDDGSTAAFTNVRLFVREDGRWMCRVWLNSPDHCE